MADSDFGNDILTLVDDEGVEHEFEVVDTLETDDNQQYMALVPLFNEAKESLEDDGELVILKVVQEEDGEFLEPIEDEEEFDRISATFVERLEEYYDFES